FHRNHSVAIPFVVRAPFVSIVAWNRLRSYALYKLYAGFPSTREHARLEGHKRVGLFDLNGPASGFTTFACLLGATGTIRTDRVALLLFVADWYRHPLDLCTAVARSELTVQPCVARHE